jgi:hypothetical protein
MVAPIVMIEGCHVPVGPIAAREVLPRNQP